MSACGRILPYGEWVCTRFAYIWIVRSCALHRCRFRFPFSAQFVQHIEMQARSKHPAPETLMERVARLTLFYVVLSVLCAPFFLIFTFPRYPTSPWGWLAFFALPIPLYVAEGWLDRRRAQRPYRNLGALDSLGRAIEKSPLRLVYVVGLVAAAGALGMACLIYFS